MAKCCISSATYAKIKPRNFKSEAKSIVKLAWPLVFSDFSEYMIPLITLLFVGQYGETSLAAVGLALSFCNITGVALLIGLDTATQTLCSQSYGAGNFQRYGVILQRALILQLIVIFSILPLWINSERILLGFHQDKEVSRYFSLLSVIDTLLSIVYAPCFMTEDHDSFFQNKNHIPSLPQCLPLVGFYCTMKESRFQIQP